MVLDVPHTHSMLALKVLDVISGSLASKSWADGRGLKARNRWGRLCKMRG